ncbi:hypothetical protein C1H46_012165 [Malus baccata]|uniref:Uncharacterized protein n=1 Tax=Malus baccata TaxID=106549 RepID=A0A540MTP3_MALBA|nr:hypothetical protein C1H46_012165 [Malus baccata]
MTYPAALVIWPLAQMGYPGQGQLQMARGPSPLECHLRSLLGWACHSSSRAHNRCSSGRGLYMAPPPQMMRGPHPSPPGNAFSAGWSSNVWTTPPRHASASTQSSEPAATLKEYALFCLSRVKILNVCCG